MECSKGGNPLRSRRLCGRPGLDHIWAGGYGDSHWVVLERAAVAGGGYGDRHWVVLERAAVVAGGGWYAGHAQRQELALLRAGGAAWTDTRHPPAIRVRVGLPVS